MNKTSAFTDFALLRTFFFFFISCFVFPLPSVFNISYGTCCVLCMKIDMYEKCL